MLTNRPDYAPERRPGDPIDITTTATDLVTLHTTTHDAPILAALLEAGAATLLYAGAATDDDINRRQRGANLGWDAARALRDETERITNRHTERHLNDARRHRNAQRKRDADRALEHQPEPLYDAGDLLHFHTDDGGTTWEMTVGPWEAT